MTNANIGNLQMKNAFVLVLLVSATFACAPACAATEPQLISKQSIATIYKSNGTVNNDAFGGGTGMGNFFDGNLTSGVYIGPNGRTDNGSYIILDFTKDSTMPSGGWFVTSFDISSATTHKYSLYYSPDGSAWTNVKDGVGVSRVGTAVYDVNQIAQKAKIVFDEIGGWTATVAEIQVYGLDPADLTCLHTHLPEWEAIQGTANCTEYGIEQRQCPDCGEWFRRESSTALPLGHDFESNLDAAGTSLQFGSGSITCKRCDWSLDLSKPANLVTNIVGGTKIGRVPVQGQVNFTDVTVSSTGQEIYGVTPNYLIDNNWTAAWNHYWFANSKSTACSSTVWNQMARKRLLPSMPWKKTNPSPTKSAMRTIRLRTSASPLSSAASRSRRSASSRTKRMLRSRYANSTPTARWRAPANPPRSARA